MSRRDIVIIKDTHRGLLYEDGLFREVLPAGRYDIPRSPSTLASFFGSKAPRFEVVLVDVRGRDRTIEVEDLLIADGLTVSASFDVQFRVADPLEALHQVESFEDRLDNEAQAVARRLLRGLVVEEVMGGRDEIGEELLRLLRESSKRYGLDVTRLDFKDLIIPDPLREAMNRAVLSGRLRHLLVEEAPDPALADDSEDDPDLIIARASFGQDPDGESLGYRRPRNAKN